MERRKFSDEFKEQVLKECQETGNVALVARRHNISPNTVHTWRKNVQKRGSVKPLPKDSPSYLRTLIILDVILILFFSSGVIAQDNSVYTDNEEKNSTSLNFNL